MTRIITCSWCHERHRIVLPPAGCTLPPVTCSRCFHRADVCRLDCTCRACKSAIQKVALTADDIEAIKADIKRRKT